MKVGTKVVIVQPVLQGIVKQRRFNSADELELLVEWPEGDNVVSRWLTANQVQETKEQS